MVNELIRENKKLKRQLDRLTTKATAATGSSIERGLKSIQRRVQKALQGATSPSRSAKSVGATSRGGRTRRTAA